MDTNREMFTAICLHSLLGVLTPEDMQLYRQNPDQWQRFSKSLSKQAIVLADAVLSQVRASRGNRASEYHNCFARCIVIFFPPGSLLCYHVRFLCTLLHSHLIQEL